MQLKRAEDFTIGQRVKHTNHGNGTVYAYTDHSDEIFIDFDIKPEDWDKVLNVSPQCLIGTSE
jgi:hypothetical protein